MKKQKSYRIGQMEIDMLEDLKKKLTCMTETEIIEKAIVELYIKTKEGE